MHERLAQLIDALTPRQQREVERIIEAMVVPDSPSPSAHLRQDWAGGLAHLRGRFASGLELQKASLQQRIAQEMRDAG